MLIGILLAAALGAAAPTNLPARTPPTNHAVVTTAAGVTNPTQPPGTIGSPLYVRAICDKGCSSDEQKTVLQKLITDPSAMLNGLLFLITFLMWWTSHEALKAAKESSEDVKQASNKQLRAYISVCKRELSLNADGTWWCTILFKNFGQTPASDVQTCWELWTDEFPVCKSDEFLKAKPTNLLSLAPSQEMTAFRRIKISEDEKSLILEKKMAVWAKGRITYKDIFGNRQFTNFHCYTNVYLGHSDSRMTLCEDGNDAS